MSDEWKVGDLALCIDDGPVKIIGGCPEVEEEYVANLNCGSIYKISQITKGRTTNVIGIADMSKRAGGIESRFVKITPQESDEFDREVIDLLIREPVA